jgi:hypothetical protein
MIHYDYSSPRVARIAVPVAATLLLFNLSITRMNVSANPADTQGHGIIKGLVADDVDPALREKLSLFGQFIGDWEIDLQASLPDGTPVTAKGGSAFRLDSKRNGYSRRLE